MSGLGIVGRRGESALDVAWGKLARMAVAVSLFGAMACAIAASPAVGQLRVVAVDSVTRVAIVKLDDARPQTWRVGDVLVLGVQRAKLRDCAGNRAVIDVVRPGAMPLTVLVAAGETYRVEAERTPLSPLRASVVPVHER